MSEGNRTGAASGSFREYLQDLKRSGSALLLTGETTVPSRGYASQAFFGVGGRDATTRRGRVLVRTAPDCFPDVFLPSGVSPRDESVRVVSLPTATSARSVVPETPTDQATSPAAPGEDELEAAARDVRETTTELVAEEGLGRDRLRVGVTSLAPLLDRSDIDTVRSFVESIADDVRAHGGMAHFHLPLPDDAPAVRQLSSTANARVELRTREDRTVESRWHLPGVELNDDPGWLPLRAWR